MAADGDLRTTARRRDDLIAIRDAALAAAREAEAIALDAQAMLDGVPGDPRVGDVIPLDDLRAAVVGLDALCDAPPPGFVPLGDDEPEEMPIDEYANAAAIGALDLDEEPTCRSCGHCLLKGQERARGFCSYCADEAPDYDHAPTNDDRENA